MDDISLEAKIIMQLLWNEISMKYVATITTNNKYKISKKKPYKKRVLFSAFFATSFIP